MTPAKARAVAAARKARNMAWQARRRVRPNASPYANGALNHWDAVNATYTELRAQGLDRPNYIWSVLHVADIARYLQIPRFSVLEFGVAGGNGLVALDRLSDAVGDLLDVEIEVYGFDTGAGLPPPQDHRDAPYIMDPGDFPMQEDQLRARLRRAELVLGMVEDTVGTFLQGSAAPVGFIAFDLDFYSSTVGALKVLDAPAERLFPRVLCYFDDVLGYPWGDCNGPRLAMAEFNAAHTERNISHLPGMKWSVPARQFNSRWAESMYLAHVFDHPRYNDDEGTALTRRLDLD